MSSGKWPIFIKTKKKKLLPGLAQEKVVASQPTNPSHGVTQNSYWTLVFHYKFAFYCSWLDLQVDLHKFPDKTYTELYL